MPVHVDMNKTRCVRGIIMIWNLTMSLLFAIGWLDR
jgi:hypothetical protein